MTLSLLGKPLLLQLSISLTLVTQTNSPLQETKSCILPIKSVFKATKFILVTFSTLTVPYVLAVFVNSFLERED